ncbi:hypothetical protein CDD83_629 [Cordyceps sp. RAO-2017]|nr:hypothetical protein CDD83_629 [Cordyceps sp. RAO-2017]
MSSFLLRRASAVASGARSFSTSSPRSLAKVTIIGNLADTPELHTTGNGRQIVRYALASNSGPRENRVTSWFRVTYFAPEGPRRDFVLSLPKGSTIYVEGDATVNTYQDANGQTRSNLSIVQRSLELLKRSNHPDAQSNEQAHNASESAA